MSTTHQRDIYTSHAAFPILASTLLPPPSRPLESPRDDDAPAEKEERTSNSTAWNLEPSFFNAFSPSLSSKYINDTDQDSKQLLRCGIIVGLSCLREWDNPDSERNRDLLGDVSRRLLSLFLLDMPSSLGSEEQQNERPTTTTATRVFIIHPIQSTTFAPETLFDSLVRISKMKKQKTPSIEDDDKTDTTISTTQAISLLDRVELLPVHDFSSATQAISQVSDAVSKIHRQHQTHLGQEISMSEEDDEGEDKHPPTTLLILEGLDTMTETIIHNSNALRGTAILTPVLRTLTHLSRMHASFLSVLLVNTTALGPPPPQSASSTVTTTPTALSQQSRLVGEMPPLSSQSPFGRTPPAAGASSIGGPYSVFARERYHHHHQRHRDSSRPENENNDTTQIEESLPLLNTLLSRTLDQGIDTHILLQGRSNQALAEVIKDRTGDGLGRWCIWRGLY